MKRMLVILIILSFCNLSFAQDTSNAFKYDNCKLLEMFILNSHIRALSSDLVYIDTIAIVDYKSFFKECNILNIQNTYIKIVDSLPKKVLDLFIPSKKDGIYVNRVKFPIPNGLSYNDHYVINDILHIGDSLRIYFNLLSSNHSGYIEYKVNIGEFIFLGGIINQE